jgi:hypothetical protein
VPKQFYVLTRDLHLYIGLFLSPFLLVFVASVFFLVHTSLSNQPAASTRVASDLAVPAGIEQLNGRELVTALRPVLKQIGVQGEVNYIRSIPKEHRLVLPISLPGRETTVDLNLLQRTATIVESSTGLAGAVVHLHKMPGPHNANIRGNSTYIRAWRWLADLATYGLLFLTLSGVYLWAVLRADRRVGLALIGAGGISFFGLIYALIR